MQVLQTVLPLLAVLALGMLCRKRQLFSDADMAAFRSLAVNFTLPAVLFSAFASAQYSAEGAVVPLLVFAACALALGLGFALCSLFRLRGRLTPYLSTGFEAGMLGYALFALLFPDESVSSFAIVDLGQVLFVFTVYKALLAGRGGLRAAAADALRSPVLWAIAAGLIVGISGIYKGALKAPLESVASFVAAPTGALILLTIGYDLAGGGIRWKSTASMVGLRLAVMLPVFFAVLWVNRALLDGIIHTGALALLFILPPPFVLPVFADMGEERAGIVSALSALTLVCLLLFAALTAWLA